MRTLTLSPDRVSIGTFIKTDSPHVVEVLGTTAMDFGIVDAEQYITQVDTQGPVLWVASPVHVTCEDGFDVWPSNPAVGYPRVLDACQGELTPDVLSYSDTIRHVVRRPREEPGGLLSQGAGQLQGD